MENAGVPDYFRKYLMGQSFGRSPIVTYTHVTEEKLNSHYRRALEQEMSDVLSAIESGWQTLTANQPIVSSA